ncbi:MAG: xanthine dehydrogenase family protein molybdopterin-binding subunit, partial [Alphaproteobacteria bacterium]
ARINSIDTAQAQAAPGVVAVCTGADWAEENYGTPPSEDILTRKDGSPLYQPPHPALVTDRVRVVGDSVAFVVAESRDQARDAAEMIAVDYDALPAITATADALKPGAPLVWDDCPDNICFYLERGDESAVEAAFARADHVVRQSMVVNRITTVTLEPRGCLGEYDARHDRYTLHTGLQRPHEMRQRITQQVFHIPETSVRVVSGDIGGSFGMRGSIYCEQLLVLWAAKKTGRPVKWICDRSEGFMSDDHARDNVSELALALDKDGKFLGLRVSTIASMGAYLGIRGPRPPIGNLGTLAGIYTTPAVYVEVTGVYCNTTPTSPYRGAGAPEAAYITERLVDIAARELDMDPAEIRRRNCVPSSAMPWTNALDYTYDCGEFEFNMDKAMEVSDWAGFEARRAESAARGRLRGIGMSNTVKKTSTPNIESAGIRFDPSGTVTLIMGTISHGQGHETIFKQIMCDRLGLDPADVRYVQGDTDNVTYGRGTFNSRSTAIGGSAVKIATDKIIEKGTRIAGHMLEAAEADITFDEGTFSVAGTDHSVTLRDVAKTAFNATALPPDIEPGLDETGAFTPQYWNWPTGVQICELEIDPDTGSTEILNFVCVDDVGTVINPALLKAQMHGGIVQGIGQALMEDIKFDGDSGQLLTGSLMDYCMPRADDLCAIEVISAPVPTASNLIGAKGGGESGPTGALPTTINAVMDALKPLGVTHMDMPATPLRVWQAIQDAKAND